jgi:hypothetical protein
MTNLIGRILPPAFPNTIPKDSQWLGGQGTGSWFSIENHNTNYRIRRFSPSGILECDRIFTSSEAINLEQQYKFTYVSHCKLCTILQNNKKIIFTSIADYSSI